MTRNRAAGLVILVGGLLFGFAGGEYGTLDWWRLRQDVRAESTATAELEAAMDSLAAYARALERDPVLQEQIARERFGMLRPGELLFQVEPAAPVERLPEPE